MKGLSVGDSIVITLMFVLLEIGLMTISKQVTEVKQVCTASQGIKNTP